MSDLSFTVADGEVVGLLGPNGSGKTTMIRLLNGLLRPDGGDIRVLGVDPLTNGRRVRQASGVLTEAAEFYPHLSGLDNLRFFANLYGVNGSARAAELLDTFGLKQHAGKPVSAYSTGMRKRLGLAKALLHEPELLFLDEPTNGLDPEGTRLVLDSIGDLQERSGATILICSHLLEQLELVCERYLFIREGRLVEAGTLEELRAKYEHGVTLEVITDLKLEEGQREYRHAQINSSRRLEGREFASGPPLGMRRVTFELSSKEEVPPLLQAVATEANLYSARVVEANLEALYFEIQGGGDE